MWFYVNTSWFFVITRKQPSRLVYFLPRLQGECKGKRDGGGGMMDGRWMNGKRMVDFWEFLSFSTVYQSFQNI